MKTIFAPHILNKRSLRGNSRPGFTLMEVLVATGIFAVGMVAVASIFPVAILLQKRTVQEINAKAFTANARAVIEIRGFDERILNADPGAPLNSTIPITRKVPDLLVWPMPEAINGTDGTDYEWAGVDRSFGVNSAASDRQVWWVPLFLDKSDVGTTVGGTNYEAERDWTVFVFILQRDYDATYAKPGNIFDWAVADVAPQNDPAYVPGVARLACTFAGDRFNFTNTVLGDRIVRVGDSVLGEDGITYKVREVDASGVRIDGIILNSPTSIWVAHPGDSGQSSFVGLVELLDDTDPVNPANRLVR